MNDDPNSSSTFDAWNTHYRNRIERLGKLANASDDEISRAAKWAFHPQGPAPDYPLNPWTIM